MGIIMIVSNLRELRSRPEGRIAARDRQTEISYARAGPPKRTHLWPGTSCGVRASRACSRHRPNGLVVPRSQDAYVTWRLASVLIQG
jgi:hypothetical protein